MRKGSGRTGKALFLITLPKLCPNCSGESIHAMLFGFDVRDRFTDVRL
jgi:hypothetical protein